MTDYTKLAVALRDTDFGDSCDYCEHSDMCKDDDCIILQAAAAIEAFQAEVKRLEPKRGEVVRCGECKWYSIYEAKKDGTPDKRYSPSVCLREIYAKRRDPDWFCADGERKVQK